MGTHRELLGKSSCEIKMMMFKDLVYWYLLYLQHGMNLTLVLFRMLQQALEA